MSADLPFPKSLPDFQRLFPDDAACGRYLEGCRWPGGFACPSCGVVAEPFRFAARPGVLRCRECRKDTSLTAGTVLERTHSAEKHLPLIHLVFSNLKAWLLGTHHAVSDRHLQAYLNEFVFRFNRRFYPFNGFRSLLGLCASAESPTYDELYSGSWSHPAATAPWELTG